MRILIDTYASHHVERFQFWHRAVESLALALNDRGHDSVVIVDGLVTRDITEALRAIPRASLVNFPRRSDVFFTRATEAELLTRMCLFHNIDAAVTAGHSYVLGVPTLVALSNESHDVVDSAALDVNLSLRLAVSMASAIVVPDETAKTALQSLLPVLSPSFVCLAEPAGYHNVIPTLLETMDTRLEWFHNPETSAIIQDYQRRAQLLQA